MLFLEASFEVVISFVFSSIALIDVMMDNEENKGGDNNRGEVDRKGSTNNDNKL